MHRNHRLCTFARAMVGVFGPFPTTHQKWTDGLQDAREWAKISMMISCPFLWLSRWFFQVHSRPGCRPVSLADFRPRSWLSIAVRYACRRSSASFVYLRVCPCGIRTTGRTGMNPTTEPQSVRKMASGRLQEARE